MKSRKPRSVKTGSSKKKAPSDVSPSTGLPPLVEGPLRCFLQVTVSRVLWTVRKPPIATFIRLRWWGESSNGTHFFPRDGAQPAQKNIKTTARFAIRCGPKQFTSYLTDMGSLVLEVLTKPDHLPIARAQVAGISRLSLSHPIGGFYTLVSPTSEKLGELQVSLNLEALVEAYDSSSSGPVTDISMEAPQTTTLTVPSLPRSLSAASGKESAGSSRGNTPRGKDHLYFQSALKDKEESLENQMPRTNRSQDGQPSSQEPHGVIGNDILSVILERGNKLRDAMVVSALKCDMDYAPALKDTPLPLPKDNIQSSSKHSPAPTGMFLQNILHVDSPVKPDAVAAVTDSHLDCSADMDNRAVDLLLGSLNTSPLPVWDGSSPEFLSGHSSVCGDSELNDPQYDQSLLENLFYKTPMTDTGPNDAEADFQRPVSLKKKTPSQSNSGGPESVPQHDTDAAGNPPGLTAEQMTLLSSIRLARVTVESLSVPEGSTNSTLRKSSRKGKPPRLLSGKKCTYFIEYVFPKASTSSRSKGGDGEVTRAAASKVTGGAVVFLQHSVFPVQLSAATVKQWWTTDLIFQIYSRNSHQKKPVLIGKAVHPLRCLLQSKELSQSVLLPVKSLEGNSETQEIGPLKISLELAMDSKDFSSEKSKSKVAWRDASPSQPAPRPLIEPGSRSPHLDIGRDDIPTRSFDDSRQNAWSPQRPRKEPFPLPGPHTSPHHQSVRLQVEEEDPDVLLHTLLMVPDGKNFNCGPAQVPNVYLNCKLFWCDEVARSVISWGRADPYFNFVQVTPVALTSKLLERMKNNVMVIEVWRRTRSSGQDGLLGLVKLPLHQFYMSFRDPKIARLLLQAQYPVLGVDCYMPVIDVFSGACRGNLRVVLALGHSEQIVALQRTRDEQYDSLSHPVRPVHLLDHQTHPQTKIAPQGEAMREHVFVIGVHKVNGLTPLQSTVWGEADCYVQYSFPCQDADPAAKVDHNLVESSANLKLFRTTTTLCVPDPMFGHTETHALLVPEGVPVQRLLLGSLSSQGLSGGGGVQFEVWCRYYYPNVRDQLVAKGMLPLSKLCAMVTMQGQLPNEAQTFSLPLIPRTDSPTGRPPQPSGFLDVCIRYKHRPMRAEGQAGRGAASRTVTLGVQVHRASGLQAAARVMAEQDERFGYFASVGVNVYVTAQMSFLPESERRSTRVAARTFCPDFDHHTELTCDLLLQRSSGETCSLAEQLEEASAVFTVWNVDTPKAALTQKPKDVMLGTVTIPLADLIHKRTGISGWYGLYVPRETSSSQRRHILVGGLEISVGFAHHSDRERVVKAAQGVGWTVAQNDTQEDEEAWGDGTRKTSLTLSMPRAWIPVHCLLLPGHTQVQRSTYCYFRYKFYDQEAFCSHMKHPSVEEGRAEGQATVAFQGSRTVELRSTLPLMWYLREERLEVQVWVAFKKDKAQRPRDTDRLVGSAFVDLSSLAKMDKQKLSLSGVYPLFRRSAADLQGAALRVHITLTAGVIPGEVSAVGDTQLDSDSQEELSLEGGEAADRAPLPNTPRNSNTAQGRHKTKSSGTTPDFTSLPHTEISSEDSFPVTVAVDQAMHLNLKGCPLVERSGDTPCCCVSYVTADSSEPVSTAVIPNTDSPVWDHQHECRLSKQLLFDPQQALVFKVWHKGEMERVLGFASVDLSPLLCGFQSVCGWYNIIDLSGQCHGQLKVSITPLKGVQELRGQRRSVNEETATNSSTLFQALPLSYQTTATYNSFPGHIRYPEQNISSPEHKDCLFSERSSESDRHCEHMDKVRLYHQSLQEQTAASSVCRSGAADLSPNSSFLFAALRKKLSELDNIQRYFSRKLSTPTFPSVSEQESTHSKPEEEKDSETDSCQLLKKSNQLVGEVDRIISGLRGQHLETIPSDPQSISSTSPVGDNPPQKIPEHISSPRVAPHSPREEEVSRPSSPVRRVSEHQTDSELEGEMMDGRKDEAALSEDDNGGGTNEDTVGTDRSREEESDEEEEDYEEVVVKPRHLNEVTSLTDKTSPWTSVMSDPDLVSLESMEAPEESDLSQDEGGGKHRCARREESDHSLSLNGSAGDASDTDGDEDDDDDDDDDDEQDLKATRAKESNIPDKGRGDKSSQATTKLVTNTHGASCSRGNQDTRLPHASVEVPNFFLPSQQLEASMRTIRLAPSFSKSGGDPVLSSTVPRSVRKCPNMSPSSMRKETERIAKIFAANFDNP